MLHKILLGDKMKLENGEDLNFKINFVPDMEQKLQKRRRTRMNCPKCGKKLPEDSIFCTGCGCSLDHTENYASQAENIPVYKTPVPQYYSNSEPATAPKTEKKNLSGITMIVLLAVVLVACVLAFIYALTLQSKNDEYRGIIDDNEIRMAQLEREADAKNREIEDLKEELAHVSEELDAVAEEGTEYADAAVLLMDLLEYIGSEESWGYCTENFHADKGIMVIDRMSGKQELRIFSTYYTTFTFEVSDDSVIDAQWSDKEWTEKETQIYITPKDYGICTVTLTNELYDNSFSVLVIVI